MRNPVVKRAAGLYLVIVASVFVLSCLWEFVLEDRLSTAHAAESAEEHWEYVLTSTAFAALAVTLPLWLRIRADLRDARLREKLQLTAAVFEHTQDAVMITDGDRRIISVNRRFTQVTGYTAEEALGKTPRLLQSGRHSEAFYRGLWASIEQTGHWKGEIWNRTKSGAVVPFWENITRVDDGQGRAARYVAVLSDISAIEQRRERLAHLAYHDPLTDLPNRSLFEDRLGHALEHAQRRRSPLAVLFIDLDCFKRVNDGLGHAVGDRVLRATADRLRRCVRGSDTVSRLGGDEFTVILEDLSDSRHAARVAEEIIASLGHPIRLDNEDVRATASIGISLFPEDGADGSALLRAADAAMYRAKQAGRDTYRFYDSAEQAGEAPGGFGAPPGRTG
ncbi:MAG: sensor domain-containing diguanylate cyclase [Chromatiales bacterium]|jgi:diguanylate cyclase (GGDEF)-like protein/PAS domain S-box-containing protein